jgi:hypothetical protein
MATVGISGKIDVQKILKEHLFSGSKGKYLDITMFVNLDEQGMYGDNGMITQNWKDQQKGEGPILGNVKVFWSDSGNAPQKKEESKPVAGGPGAENDFDDDIPFSQPNFLLA